MLSIISKRQAELISGVKFETPHKIELLWTDYEDTSLIVNLLKYSSSILEIGTHRGFTTKNIYDNSRVIVSIDTVDISKDMNIDLMYQNNEILDKSQIGEKVKGNEDINIIIQKSDDYFKYCIDNHITYDGIFIDGDHSYEQVKKDSENALNCCNNNGIIVWHDVYNKEGNDAKTLAQPNNMGVIQALEELNVGIYKIENSWVGFTIC